ncbi:hypothetical protein CBO05C_3047 [Clostridium botulinum B str. Osaka05]|uniref:Uncharacterized protein n=1 Tax=Clostridium botulinum B str. Osaka05 TaxID=1407017 RepID=A0A0S6U4T2_CLOBO|nr:hypothetical protein CBO05C_3047 [Clostridium botulinum B str. Osaka05]
MNKKVEPPFRGSIKLKYIMVFLLILLKLEKVEKLCDRCKGNLKSDLASINPNGELVRKHLFTSCLASLLHFTLIIRGKSALLMTFCKEVVSFFSTYNLPFQPYLI